jgi:hypothetical protein
MTIPIYNSEIAPPGRRGLVAGLHAQFVGFGELSNLIYYSRRKTDLS